MAFHSVHRNKRVLVRLVGGAKFIDRFLERTARTVIFEKAGVIANSKILSISIFKGQV